MCLFLSNEHIAIHLLCLKEKIAGVLVILEKHVFNLIGIQLVIISVLTPYRFVYTVLFMHIISYLKDNLKTLTKLMNKISEMRIVKNKIFLLILPLMCCALKKSWRYSGTLHSCTICIYIDFKDVADLSIFASYSPRMLAPLSHIHSYKPTPISARLISSIGKLCLDKFSG
jgi:hypothetical protein